MSPSIRASEARVLVQRQIDAVNAAKHVLAMATDLTRVSAQERLINEQAPSVAHGLSVSGTSEHNRSES